MNNLNVMTVSDPYFCDSFGFTDDEVKELLDYYGLRAYHDAMRDWYDGYKFGSVSVYCPWDVIKYTQILLRDPEAEPENYWANTSGNGIIRRLLKKADQTTRDEVEQLINGESIVKTVRQELTYRDIEDSIDNIWSVLYSTGYLTSRGRLPGKQMKLALPNREVRELFIDLVKDWFREETRADTSRINRFCAGYAPRLPVGFHQRAGHGGAVQYERKLLPRDAAGPTAKSGKLDRPLQCRNRHRVQRYFGRHPGAVGDSHRAEICRGRQPRSCLRQSSGPD